MKKHKFKMTIIMPSYNNGQYIRQALDSILYQRVDFNYQIIVTDDCSQDDSPEIIAEYEEKYPDKVVGIYSKENCKLFRNVLKAMKKMDSEYFCVLDPDDYWTDEGRLQKSVDFLDENPDYTIYATNLQKIYNDGSVEMKYNLPGLNAATSTYEDYMNGKAVLSCTPSSTYRNVYFSDGIPREYLDLLGTQFEEAFRADTARNLIHLKRGKAYFVNESIGCCRYHGKGLASSMSECEKYIMSAFSHIGYYNFFGKENEELYIKFIKKLYTRAVKEYLFVLISGKIPDISEHYQKYFKVVSEWLKEHQGIIDYERLPFSLKKYSEIGKRQTAIWGTGSAARKIIEGYGVPIHQDTFFVDNNPDKQGKEFMGREIKAPSAILKNPDCLVIIANSYYNEIIEQIRTEGLCDEDRIINIYDYKENWL